MKAGSPRVASSTAYFRFLCLLLCSEKRFSSSSYVPGVGEDDFLLFFLWLLDLSRDLDLLLCLCLSALGEREDLFLWWCSFREEWLRSLLSRLRERFRSLDLERRWWLLLRSLKCNANGKDNQFYGMIVHPNNANLLLERFLSLTSLSLVEDRSFLATSGVGSRDCSMLL